MELWTSTYGGALLAPVVLLPFVGMLLGLLLGGRQVQRVAQNFERLSAMRRMLSLIHI